MSVHPELKETNVRLPPCGFDALAAVMARQGASRDATVRRLLAEHVERQEQEYPEDRLTHISTVLRYPPPRWRKDLRQDRPLRLRASTDMPERARAVSLVLPGQYQRAFRDYQSRLLTDAVVTAIAVAEPSAPRLPICWRRSRWLPPTEESGRPASGRSGPRTAWTGRSDRSHARARAGASVAAAELTPWRDGRHGPSGSAGSAWAGARNRSRRAVLVSSRIQLSRVPRVTTPASYRK